MSLRDYIGRSLDLCIFSGLAQFGMQPVTQTLQGNTACTGVQKLAQLVTIWLLTIKGSVMGHPTWGTDFLMSVRSGRVRTTADLTMVFGGAAVDILNFTTNERPGPLPDDEVLVSLTLESAAVLGDHIDLTARITTAAGAARTALLPIRVPLIRR